MKFQEGLRRTSGIMGEPKKVLNGSLGTISHLISRHFVVYLGL